MQVETRNPIGHSAAEMATRLLIVDDDTELTRLLTELLGQEGFEVDAQPGGADAVARATTGAYALVILDVMLPDISGFDILRQIRRTSNIPVILLTARGDDVDRIVGLEIGADDYVPKPFHLEEVLARIQSGEYAKDFVVENRAGAPVLLSRRRMTAELPIEQVGARLREMMPWIRKNRLVDTSKN